MRALEVLLLVLLLASPIGAVDVSAFLWDDPVWTIRKASGVGRDIVLDTSTLSGTNQEKGDLMATLAQIGFEFEIPLSQLPSDDPDRTIDPNNECMFHRSGGGPPRLVSRSTIVVGVTWDGVSEPLAALRNCDRTKTP